MAKWTVVGGGAYSGSFGAPGGGSGSVTNSTGALTANLPVFGNGGADIKTGLKRGNTTTTQMADNTTPPSTGNVAIFDANGNIKDGGASAVTHSTGAFTANLPVFGNGTNDLKVGTAQGNTTKVQLASGSPTTSAPLVYDASGNAVAGTRSGSTTAFVTVSGTATANYALFFDASGNAVARQPRGNTTVVQLADSTTNPTGGHVAVFDANGNVTDGGAAPAVGIALKTNSVSNTSQSQLNLVAGTNVALTSDGSGNVTIAEPYYWDILTDGLGSIIFAGGDTIAVRET